MDLEVKLRCYNACSTCCQSDQWPNKVEINIINDSLLWRNFTKQQGILNTWEIIVSAWERKIEFVCVSLTINAWELRALKLEHQAQSSFRIYDLEVRNIQSIAERPSTQKFQLANFVNNTLIYSQTLLSKMWHRYFHLNQKNGKHWWQSGFGSIQSWMTFKDSLRYWHETIKDKNRRTSKNKEERKESNSCTCEPTTEVLITEQ